MHLSVRECASKCAAASIISNVARGALEANQIQFQPFVNELPPVRVLEGHGAPRTRIAPLNANVEVLLRETNAPAGRTGDPECPAQAGCSSEKRISMGKGSRKTATASTDDDKSIQDLAVVPKILNFGE